MVHHGIGIIALYARNREEQECSVKNTHVYRQAHILDEYIDTRPINFYSSVYLFVKGVLPKFNLERSVHIFV